LYALVNGLMGASMLVRGNYLVKQQKVNFAGTYECVPLQRLPLYSSVWDNKQPMTANV